MSATPYHLVNKGVTIRDSPNDGGSNLLRSDLNTHTRYTLRHSGETRKEWDRTNGISSSGPTLRVAPRDLAMAML